MATTSLQRILWLGAILGAATGGLLAADGPPRGRPIEFSEPRDERGTTNAPSLMPSHTTLIDRMEADINHPFRAMVPGNSLNGMIMTDPQPMPLPARPSARVRDIKNRKQDKMYLTTEEMFEPKSLEDAYKGPELTPDGRDVNSLRPLERQMMRSFNADRSRQLTNQAGPIQGPGYSRTDGGLFVNPNGSKPSFGTISPVENKWRKTFGSDIESATARAREMRDSHEFFGLGAALKPAPKLTTSELQSRDAFMQMVDGNYTPSVGGTAPSGGLFSPDSSFYDPPKPVVAPPLPTTFPGSYGNPANSATPYTPSYVPPAPVQAPPPTAPVSPFMNLPRRNY